MEYVTYIIIDEKIARLFKKEDLTNLINGIEANFFIKVPRLYTGIKRWFLKKFINRMCIQIKCHNTSIKLYEDDHIILTHRFKIKIN